MVTTNFNRSISLGVRCEVLMKAAIMFSDDGGTHYIIISKDNFMQK